MHVEVFCKLFHGNDEGEEHFYVLASIMMWIVTRGHHMLSLRIKFYDSGLI